MSIPQAINYEAPLEPWPVSRADWRIDTQRSALLIHDMQRYFLRPYATSCSALKDAIANTASLIDKARASNIPIFYTAQTGVQSEIPRGLQADLWGSGMQPIPEHTEIISELTPSAQDTVLVKHRYDAFAHSPLREKLEREGRDQLLICGVYAHIGVLATAFSAFQSEIKPFVVADAVADFGAVEHRRALEQIASCCGVVTLTSEVLDEL